MSPSYTPDMVHLSQQAALHHQLQELPQPPEHPSQLVHEPEQEPEQPLQVPLQLPEQLEQPLHPEQLVQLPVQEPEQPLQLPEHAVRHNPVQLEAQSVLLSVL